MYTQIDPTKLPATVSAFLPTRLNAERIPADELKPLIGFTNASEEKLYIVESYSRLWLIKDGNPLLAWPPEIAQAFADQQRGVISFAGNAEFPRREAYNLFGIKDPVQAAIDRTKEDNEIQARVTALHREAPPVSRDEEADGLAMSFMHILYDGSRQRALAFLRSKDPELYALVKSKMDNLRAGAKLPLDYVAPETWKEATCILWSSLKPDDTHVHEAFEDFLRKLPEETCSRLSVQIETARRQHGLNIHLAAEARGLKAAKKAYATWNKDADRAKTEAYVQRAAEERARKYGYDVNDTGAKIYATAASSSAPPRGQMRDVVMFDEMQLPAANASTGDRIKHLFELWKLIRTPAHLERFVARMQNFSENELNGLMRLIRLNARKEEMEHALDIKMGTYAGAPQGANRGGDGQGWKPAAPAQDKMDSIEVPDAVMKKMFECGGDPNRIVPIPLHLRKGCSVEESSAVNSPPPECDSPWFLNLPKSLRLIKPDGVAALYTEDHAPLFSEEDKPLEARINQFIGSVTAWMHEHMESPADEEQIFVLTRWIAARLSMMQQHRYMRDPFPVVIPSKPPAASLPDVPVKLAAMAVTYELPLQPTSVSPRKALVDLVLKAAGKAQISSNHFDISLPKQMKEDLLKMRATNAAHYKDNFGGDFDPNTATHLFGFKILDWDADGLILFYTK